MAGEARSHMTLKELIKCFDFIVRFSTLALLTFEAKEFFGVGTVLYVIDSCHYYPPIPSCDKPKIAPDITRYPWRG